MLVRTMYLDLAENYAKISRILYVLKIRRKTSANQPEKQLAGR